MRAHNILFSKYKNVRSKRRTVCHLTDVDLNVGDYLVARDRGSPREQGPFLRVTAVERGMLLDFLKRPGEVDRLVTSEQEYLTSWDEIHPLLGHDVEVLRVEFEYVGIPLDEESVDALTEVLSPVEGICLVEDARILKELHEITNGKP